MVQTSGDRLERAVNIAKIWDGPMSVVLFVRSTEEDIAVLEGVFVTFYDAIDTFFVRKCEEISDVFPM